MKLFKDEIDENEEYKESFVPYKCPKCGVEEMVYVRYLDISLKEIYEKIDKMPCKNCNEVKK